MEKTLAYSLVRAETIQLISTYAARQKNKSGGLQFAKHAPPKFACL